MKVLLVGPYNSPIIKRLVKALKFRGVDVYLASHEVTSKSNGTINLGKLDNIFNYFRFDKINKLVKDINPDVVHAHVLNHYGLMCMFQSKPLIVALWGSEVMLAPHEGSWLKRTFYSLINKIVLFRADWLHTSGCHIVTEANKQSFNNIDEKMSLYYWGFPLRELDEKKSNLIKHRLLKEFGIDSYDYCVFPRGLSDVYNPELCANIINKLNELKIFNNKIIVLQGFSTDAEIDNFYNMLKNKSIIFIDRLLNDDELSFLYSRCKFHFSIPKSDALGGGVIEPALRGSYPILSNLPSYVDFSEKKGGYIIQNTTDSDINKLCSFLEENILNENLNCNDLSEYKMEVIVDKILTDYSRVKQRT